VGIVVGNPSWLIVFGIWGIGRSVVIFGIVRAFGGWMFGGGSSFIIIDFFFRVAYAPYLIINVVILIRTLDIFG
jgi:hypothetical protein